MKFYICKKRVKEYLFKKYGIICMVCEKKFKRKELQLHHIVKFEHSHYTTVEDSRLACYCCHKRIHHNELYNKKEYTRLNVKVRNYKAIH